MSDTAPSNPTNVTATATAPTPAPAPSAASAPAPSLAPVRVGFASFLLLVGAVLLAVAALYFISPSRISSLKGVPNASRWELLKQNNVWPGAVWTLTFGLAAVAGGYVLATGLNRADCDSPAWLRRVSAYVLLGAALMWLCVSGYHFARAGGFQQGLTALNTWAMIATVLLAAAGAYLLRTPPPPGPAGSDQSLAVLRIGFGGFVAVVGLLLLTVAFFYFVYPQNIAPLKDAASQTWNDLFRQKAIWMPAVWSLTFGLLALAGGYVLMSGLDHPERNSPAWLFRAVACVFFGGVVAAACVSGYLFWQERGFQAGLTHPLNIYAMFLAVALATTGGFLFAEPAPQGERLRQFLLGTGLMAGALTFVLGVALATITFSADFNKGFTTWQARPFVLAWPVGAGLAGLLLLFLSVQPGTPMIRSSQTIRRVVNAANFAVAVLLMLGLLVVVYVLSWADPMTRWFGRSYDWTAQGFHELSPQTRNFLAGMRQPYKVYVLMPPTQVRQDVVTMLDNCKGINGNLSYEVIDVDNPATLALRDTFARRYKLSEASGLVVLAGAGDNADYFHVRENDLYESERDERGQRKGYVFKGEQALMGALLTLSEGNVKIYFTTGHGERSLGGGEDFRMPPMGQQKDSLSTLRSRLTDRKSVKVETLTLDKTTKEIPKDATMVVIARPKETFSTEEAQVLREYLHRQRKTRTEKNPEKGDLNREVTEVTTGKLLLLLDLQTQTVGGKVVSVPTGLEKLLEEYNVKLGDNIVLTASRRPAESVLALTNPQSSSPIGPAFNPPNESANPTIFPFSRIRTVEATQGKGGGATSETLLMVPIARDQIAWAEPNLTAALARPDSPNELADEMRRDPRKLQPKFEAASELRIEGGRISYWPVAVSVSDSGGGAPMDKHHAAVRTGDEPRMVVFGSSSWITNEEMGRENQFGEERAALFTSCVNWLNRQESVGKLNPVDKRRVPYNPNVKQDAQKWLYSLPVLLMLGGVVVVGAGVWVVRRR